MNATEKKYTIERINQILKRKTHEICGKTTTLGKELSTEDKITMVQKGTVKPRRVLSKRYGLPSFAELFDFSKYEKVAKVDQGKRTKLLDALDAEARRIRDEIMLGDSKEALKLIAAFEKF